MRGYSVTLFLQSFSSESVPFNTIVKSEGGFLLEDSDENACWTWFYPKPEERQAARHQKNGL
jgi:hypothetical protein